MTPVIKTSKKGKKNYDESEKLEAQTCEYTFVFDFFLVHYSIIFEISHKMPLLSVSAVPTCGNKDCKVTNESPNYGCDDCNGVFHWDCLGLKLKDIDRCLPCAEKLNQLDTVEEVEETQDDSQKANEYLIDEAFGEKEMGQEGELI